MTETARKYIEEKLRSERNTGALIYITKKDNDGNPLNLKIKDDKIETGYWPNRLNKYPLNWIVIYSYIDNSSGNVWIGDVEDIKDYSTRTERGDPAMRYIFHLKNVQGPVEVHSDVNDFAKSGFPQSNPRKLTSLNNENLENDLINIIKEQIKIDQDNIENITERSQTIMTRLGQGDFREKVLEVWGGKCAVTGSDLKEVLRASHIKPWKDSNDEERLNPYNGIPLAATFDALFDRGLISFNDNGDIKISRYLSKKNQKSLGINKEDKVEGGFFEENIPFLEHHRNNIFKK